jgi:glycine/sarcosine N-methyltransferase
MNAFYESIAEWYDFIFPSDPEHVPFILGRVRPADGRILDIGCGTGSLAAALGGKGFEVTGIDSDAEMIRRSRLKSERSTHIRFACMDMRDLVQHFGPRAFQCVVCFGNTLVHLNAMEEVSAFIRQVHAVLRDGGMFLLQILNYDHVLDHDVTRLPLIENEKIRFERTYGTDEESGLLRFKTVLTVKDSSRILNNEVTLLPIRKAELEAAIHEAGFRNIEWFGDFLGNPLTETSLPLVGAAVR